MIQQDRSTSLEVVPYCSITGQRGITLYEHLQDRIVPDRLEEWSLSQCPDCGHVWLNPRFTPHTIGLAYDGYSDYRWTREEPLASTKWKYVLKQGYFSAAHGYTHPTKPWYRFIGQVVRLIAPLRERLDRQVMFLHKKDTGKLLDIGSGSGWFLHNMQQFGWEVEGVDIDSVSAEKAQRRGVRVRIGSLEEQHYPDNTFHAITMSHVIEHLHNPHKTLTECLRILKPGGKIVVITPNIESMGHRYFGRDWVGLDPPRHLELFTLQSMLLLVKQVGFHIQCLKTTAVAATDIWFQSSAIAKTGFHKADNRETLPALLFYGRESLRLMWDKKAGEEIVFIGQKR